MISSPNSNTQEITNVDLDNIFLSEKSKQGFSSTSRLSKLIQNFCTVNEKEKYLETYVTDYYKQDSINNLYNVNNDNSNLRAHRHKADPYPPKSHTCPTCGRLFIQLVHLEHHIRTHTVERPYPCQACNKRFPTSSGLKRHCKIHRRK